MKENRTARLEMRIRPAEKEKILRAAKRCGLPVTKYVLKCCSGVEPRQKPPDAFWDIPNDLANMGRSMDETQRMDRPHIIYCEKTGKYIAWMKIMAGEVSQFLSYRN